MVSELWKQYLGHLIESGKSHSKYVKHSELFPEYQRCKFSNYLRSSRISACYKELSAEKVHSEYSLKSWCFSQNTVII